MEGGVCGVADWYLMLVKRMMGRGEAGEGDEEGRRVSDWFRGSIYGCGYVVRTLYR